MYDEQKSREPEIAPELIALERHLRGMTPAVPRIDRDQMMFAAGQAAGAATATEPGRDGRAMYDRAGRPLHIAGPSWAGRRFWPAATFTMTAATLLLATIFVWQRQSFQVASHGNEQLPTTIAVSAQPHMGMADSPVRSEASPFVSPAFQQAARNGYLSIRYAALTRGVDAWRPSSQPSAGDGDSDNETPRTQRKMLEELLPSRKRQMNPQSSF
jgi:hypothetical protein